MEMPAEEELRRRLIIREFWTLLELRCPYMIRQMKNDPRIAYAIQECVYRGGSIQDALADAVVVLWHHSDLMNRYAMELLQRSQPMVLIYEPPFPQNAEEIRKIMEKQTMGNAIVMPRGMVTDIRRGPEVYAYEWRYEVREPNHEIVACDFYRIPNEIFILHWSIHEKKYQYGFLNHGGTVDTARGMAKFITEEESNHFFVFREGEIVFGQRPKLADHSELIKSVLRGDISDDDMACIAGVQVKTVGVGEYKAMALAEHPPMSLTECVKWFNNIGNDIDVSRFKRPSDPESDTPMEVPAK